ncbi:MAG: hypothetical protein R3E86_06545 [Pseudomonadales bacterium]
MREDGKPINGALVRRTADGALLERDEYENGFPNGLQQEWYENGQLKSERTLRYEDTGPGSGHLVNVGTSRQWCENGTLQIQYAREADGITGTNEAWNCAGHPVAFQKLPFGESRRWHEFDGTDETVLAEEGVTAKGGGWIGLHKTYHPNGKPAVHENWQDGALDGEYTRWTPEGTVEEQGGYSKGQKIGTWVLFARGTRTVTEYDASKFVDPAYAAPFMAAIGLQPGRPEWPLTNNHIDPDKARYYVSEHLIDITKPINLEPQQPGRPFSTSRWTYPYVEASTLATALLEELGADPKAADSTGHTRLHYCLYSLGSDARCSTAEVQRLLGLGLGVNDATAQGNTPLHEVLRPHPYSGGIVSDDKLLAVADILLDAGGDPDMLDGQGKSPLMLAVLTRKFPIAMDMLAKSRNPTQTDSHGLNLVHLAFFVEPSNQFQLGLTDPVRAFVDEAVKRGVDVNQPIGSMGTLKQVALQSGAVELAQYLTSLGAT